jgi:hypothetical protein
MNEITASAAKHATEALATSIIVPLATALESDSFRAEWHLLACASDNFRAIHQTPVWCAHKVRASGERIDVLVTRSASGELTAVAPLWRTTFPISFRIGTLHWQKSLRSTVFMGNMPILPAGQHLVHDFFRALARSSDEYDCLEMRGVPTTSSFYEYITTSPEIASAYIIHMLRGPFHWLNLPQTFPEYLAQFTSKQRYNLKREVSVLRSHGGGSLELTRIESADQIFEFLESATAIAANSWQLVLLNQPIGQRFDRAQSLNELANSGILRCYLLKCAGRPCAFAVGFQIGATFTFYETAYDRVYASYSPGKVLLYLLLEDVIGHNRPENVFFGTGDADYKAFFGDSVGDEANIVLIKRTYANLAWWKLHALYRGAIEALKRLAGTG